MLEKVAALEICVRVDNGIQVGLVPSSILFDLLDLGFVCPLKHSVARNVIPSLFDILAYPS